MAKLVEKVLEPKRPIVVKDLVDLLDFFADADVDFKIREGKAVLRAEWTLKLIFGIQALVTVEYLVEIDRGSREIKLYPHAFSTLVSLSEECE